MPLAIGLVWAAIFVYAFFQASGRGARTRWIYLAVAAVGLIVGAAFTVGSEG